MQIISKLFFLLTFDEKKKLAILFLMVLIMALIDMAGIASIMPFIAVISNPEIIETNPLINNFYNFTGKLGVENKNQFFFISGILLLILLISSLLFKAITFYAQFRYTQMREFSIGKRLIEKYLNQPYSWFLNSHSADLAKNILSEVRIVVYRGLSPMLNLFANIIIVLVLLSLLIYINLKIALITILILGFSYGFIYLFVKDFLNKIGKKSVKADSSRYTAISEAFGATKEIKLGGFEKIYTDRFSNPSQKFASYQASSKIISQLPRYVLEGIAFGGIILYILKLIGNNVSFNSTIPIIALYVFAGYRLMPALQQIYTSFTSLRFVGPALENLYNDYLKLEKKKITNNDEKLIFENKITLDNINYKYPNSDQTILEKINLVIEAKSRVGIVGKTGSGKTTLIDIILGLLDVERGNLKIDEIILNENNKNSWQKNIGYVPQKIFLIDDTIAANIALGQKAEDIDHKKIIKASKIANLHEFVEKDLALKYETKIGERGIRLSGGQIQRIGIARALYHEKKLLVFDEATSALDYQTEKLVMKALNNINKDITIIIIAHRLNTIKECDKIILLENGKIIANGSYDELTLTNKTFQKFISSN